MKRTLDIAISATAMVILAPLGLLIAGGIRLTSPGPILYRQARRGRGNETFVLVKFRTMVADADEQLDDVMHLNLHARHGDERMYKIADDPRVTRLGSVLRRHSLDELPQLWNVLCGDMSLVGPRPLMLDEDMHVGEFAAARRTVRPGLTGPWQVSGRNELSFDQMLELDCAYARERTLIGDLALLLRTVPAVARPQPPC